MLPNKREELILWFNEVTYKDTPLVGGKNSSLGEMFRELTSKGVKVPNGFAITAYAYEKFLDEAKIRDKIVSMLKGLDKNDSKDLERRGHQIRETILAANFPEELNQAIAAAYEKLEKEYGTNDLDVAVRSSATAEDLPDASFAGQQETFLNIKGKGSLLYACKRCMASLFTNRAISYREDKHFDHFKVAISIGVQKMIRSDLASSGVIFSIDTETGFDQIVLVTGSVGLGENVVQGSVNPDEFLVFKPTLKEGKRPIISKKLGSKELKMVYSSDGTKSTKNIRTPKNQREKYCIEEEEIVQLAKWAVIIEDHYSSKNGKYTPMDIEWAKDGQTNELYIVQARPETVHSQKDRNKLHKFSLKGDGKVLVTGSSVGSAIGHGKVKVIKDVKEMSIFEKGDVLVTEMTDPDWEPILKKAAAVVTDKGGRTCHAAIISRELGIPCIVGTGVGTTELAHIAEVTIDCSSGETGRVLEGIIPFQTEDIDLGAIPTLKTKITVNIANPGSAFETSFLPVDGVGLARLEFIISNHIKCHPIALLHPEKLDEVTRKKVQATWKGYGSGKDFFVEKLAEGMGIIAAGFYPRRVIIRFSDFKTDEYANLLGGQPFEPEEANPMIGWRGASRYYHENYRKGFELECLAVKRVRDYYGLTNLQVMIPFVRTVEEAKKVLSVMESVGLKRGESGLQVMGMCEIPSNVILAEEFLEVLDGFSIGSNDLTQLVLGIDRNSEIVSKIFDERNEAVKRMIAKVIKVCRDMNKYIGICGQAPSDFPDFASFLVEQGIESISLNADTVIPTIFKLYETEQRLKI